MGFSLKIIKSIIFVKCVGSVFFNMDVRIYYTFTVCCWNPFAFLFSKAVTQSTVGCLPAGLWVPRELGIESDWGCVSAFLPFLTDGDFSLHHLVPCESLCVGVRSTYLLESQPLCHCGPWRWLRTWVCLSCSDWPPESTVDPSVETLGSCPQSHSSPQEWHHGPG